MEYISKEMVKRWNKQGLYKGYRLLAVDGSDIRLPKNENDNNSYIRNDDNTKGYNLLHLDAMYGNVIIIADRGYETFNNIAHFQEKWVLHYTF